MLIMLIRLFQLFFVLVACQESEQKSARSLETVDVRATQKATHIIAQNQTSKIESIEGTIFYPEGSFESDVIIIVTSDGGGESITVDTKTADGNIVGLANKDIKVCLNKVEDTQLKNIEIISSVDQIRSVTKSFVEDSDFCVFTRVASGTIKTVKKDIHLSKEMGFWHINLTSKTPLQDLSMSENIELTVHPNITDSLLILWTGSDAELKELNPIAGKICLISKHALDTITDISSDQSLIHHSTDSSNGTSCLELTDVLGSFAPGPQTLQNATITEATGSSLTVELNHIEKDDKVLIYNSECIGSTLTEAIAGESGILKIPFSNLQDGGYSLYTRIVRPSGSEGHCYKIGEHTVDTTPPSAASITISNGTHTSAANHDLILTATDASQMYITNTSGCTSNGQWEVYATSKSSWSLGQTNATATVYAKFKDVSDNETACLSDQIIHDDQAPTSPTISLASGESYTNTESISLSMSAEDANHMYITNTSGCSTGGTWESYAPSKSEWTLGESNQTTSVFIKFKDDAGNETACISDDIIHDNTSPTAPTNLDDSVETSYTNQSSRLTWVASSDSLSGMASYEIALGVSPGATDVQDWTDIGNITSTTLTNLSLTPGNTYYVSLRSLDQAGNKSNATNSDGFRVDIINDIRGSYKGTCARVNNNQLKCWGNNSSGELGLGTTSNMGDESEEMGINLDTIDLGTNRSPTHIISGWTWHTCAILDNQSLKCWGYNSYGELGRGATNSMGNEGGEMGDNLAAIDLGTNRTVKDVSIGEQSTCAILDTDEVKCWGNNDSGQLGKGDTNHLGNEAGEMGDNLTAIDLGTNRTALQLSSGLYHVCAILDDHSVKCWGNNDSGQLGKGNTTQLGDTANEMGDNLTAVDLGTNRTALQLSSGYYHMCAKLDDLSLKCWGYNGYGQLGKGNMNNLGNHAGEMGDNLNAIDLGTNRTVQTVSSGAWHNCAVLDNQKVKCWGYSGEGQLGLENTDTLGDENNEMGDNLPYVNFGSNVNIIQISAGAWHNCALFDNNKVKCWGYNDKGQLGLENMDHLGDQSTEMGDNLPYIDL